MRAPTPEKKPTVMHLRDRGRALRATARYLAAPLHCLRLPVRRITGRTRTGEPATIHAAGHGTSLESLLQRILPAERQEQPRTTRPLPGLLARMAAEADDTELTIARVPRIVADLCGHAGQLSMPDAVVCEAELGELQKRRASHSSVRSSEARRRKAGLGPTFAPGDAEVDAFYDAMYLPFARTRYGAAALIRERTSLRRRARGGGIMWVLRGEERVGGALVEVQARQLHLVSLGTPLPFEEAHALGVMAAVYGFAADLAASMGLESLDLGTAMPWLSDGPLSTKKYWGARLACTRAINHVHLVGWRRHGPASRAWLGLAPVLLTPRGRLVAAGICADDQPLEPADALRLYRRHHVDGIEGFLVVGEPGWADETKERVPGLHLTGPSSSADLAALLERVEGRP
jgi:hypothetical protein